ncbi:conserved hypothetical protein [Rhodococcus jostii RHA1]|uniref:Uncharacterized protein n=1 Tax=Rhodococcus jostii (strain RHA1) TaxID=101510 RepID=Q0SBW2_RHOJR|nr:hypothetical protein [Rhodococcus jostii]ABG94974.1 conserved hypothetical protein [Rhodococcus jostii RHA1]
MSWHIGMLPPETPDLGAIAHGPAILARSQGLQVGLRTIIAYKGGLEIAVMVVATGAHADVAERQYKGAGRDRPGHRTPEPPPGPGGGLPVQCCRRLDRATISPPQHRRTIETRHVPARILVHHE